MGKLVSLNEVNASVLPAKVLVLLSKYAQAVRKHTGLVVKISSLNVFKHVHNTNKITSHIQVRQLHRELLIEVNGHLREGTMQTNQQRELGNSSNLLHGKDGNVVTSKNSGDLNSNNLEIETSLSINF